MADSYLGYLTPGSPDKKLDSESLTVGANTVERERIQVTGSGAVEIARVLNAPPDSTDYGLVVRTIAEDASVGPTNLTASGQAATLSDLIAQGVVAARISGTFVGTVTFEGSVDGANWFTTLGTTATTFGAFVSTATAGAYIIFPVAGFKAFRARCSAYTSGTIGVDLRSSRASSVIPAIMGPLPTGTNSLGSITTISSSITPGSAAANLGKAEDAAHASGDVGVMSLAVRRDTPVANANASADGDYSPLILDNFGRLRVNTQPGPTEPGIETLYKNLDVTSAFVKASAGVVKSYFIANRGSGERFVKFYNKASAPTLGTDVPVLTIPLAAGDKANLSGLNWAFSTGIAIGATTGIADNNSGAVTTNDIVVSIGYI